MNNGFLRCLGAAAAMCLFSMFGCSSQVARNFNADWRFVKGSQPAEAAQPGFDDSAWQQVRLPHDWAISGPFNPGEHGFSAKLPWKGVGWYRKTFTLESTDAGKQVYLDFDGVMAFPKIYVNGQLAGQWDYGYSPFRVNATPFVQFGQQNVIAVEVDTQSRALAGIPVQASIAR
jgi:beta-galactosidase